MHRLVDANWRAWLSDFGSARQEGNVVVNDTAPTGGFHKSVMDGTTMMYTAPEVLSNSPATKASDVFALGVPCVNPVLVLLQHLHRFSCRRAVHHQRYTDFKTPFTPRDRSKTTTW